MTDPLNRKAYFCIDEKKPEERKTLTWFCEFPQLARHFKTRDEAEWGRKVLLNRRLTVPSIEGGTYMIENFEIEEFDGKLIISCSVPFLYKSGMETIVAAESTSQPDTDSPDVLEAGKA